MSPTAVRSLGLGVTVCMAVALGVWGFVAAFVAGSPAEVQAATMAAGICWSAVLPGLVLFVLKDDANWGMMAAGVAMLLRLMLCLGAAAAFQFSRHPLVKHGMLEMLVVFYIALLVAEVGLFVGLASRWPAAQGAKVDDVKPQSSEQG
jgi:uncharacterized membrane protein HdeD (DUF308 family)